MLKKEFTATEVMMLMERVEKQFRVFGETQEAIRKKLDATFEMTGENKEDIELLKTLARKNKEDVDLIKALSRKNTDDIGSIKFEIMLIKKRLDDIGLLLTNKADQDEYTKLGKKLLVLEKKLKTA